MSDEPPGLNAPRRKARFRSQYEQQDYRRIIRRPGSAPASPEQPISEEATPETIPAGEMEPSDETPASLSAQSEEAVATGPSPQPNALLPNFRLNKVYEPRPQVRSPLKDWRWLLLTFALLAAGLGGGYVLGHSSAPAVERPIVSKEPPKPPLVGLSPEMQAAVDAAFSESKSGHYEAARSQFNTLREQHPEMWSMAVESARNSLYLHDAQGARHTLASITTEAGQADANFIQGLLHLTNKELNLAEGAFSRAVALDPARPDIFFFWGECLRRDGKPREAVDKFRSALLRNQYENAEGLYQLKLWISQIQADQEETGGANQEIDKALAESHPSYAALFAAAAREIKAKRYPKAAEWITRAQAVTEPTVFRVILQDPTFLEESALHPEIAAFYK